MIPFIVVLLFKKKKSSKKVPKKIECKKKRFVVKGLYCSKCSSELKSDTIKWCPFCGAHFKRFYDVLV